MDPGSVLFVLAMLVGVAAYVLRPVARPEASPRPTDGRPSALEAERERLLEALQELDFDYSLGKVPERDYRPQRQALTVQGAQVLRSIDEQDRGRDSLERELEAAVAQARARPAGEIRFCHRCGSQVLAGDRFCSHCGAAQRESGD